MYIVFRSHQQFELFTYKNSKGYHCVSCTSQRGPVRISNGAIVKLKPVCTLSISESYEGGVGGVAMYA